MQRHRGLEESWRESQEPLSLVGSGWALLRCTPSLQPPQPCHPHLARPAASCPLPMPCLCLCTPTSKLRSALESCLLQARPISSMGGGEESSRGRHRVPEGVAAASGQRLPVLRACGPKKFPLSPLAGAPPSMPSLAVQAELS